MKDKLIVLAVSLFLLSTIGLAIFVQQPASGVSVILTTFSNSSDEYTTNFNGKGYDNSVSIIVPNNSTVDAATLQVSGSAFGGDYPMNVTIDVGDDSKTEWRFMGTGYGALGQQRFFKEGYTGEKSFFFDSSTPSYTEYIKLPKNATVTSATMGLNQFTVPNYGLKIAPYNGDGTTTFSYPYTYSSDYSTTSYRPKLSVAWSGGSYTSPQSSTLKDAMTSPTYASNNYGTYTYLMYYYAANGWIQFDLSSVPSSTQLTSAALQLRVGYSGGTKDMGIFAVTGSWTESGITHNNQPTVYPVPFAHKTTTGYQYVTIDVKNLVQQWVGTTPSNVGIDIGGGGADWSHSGSFTGSTTTSDLASYFNNALSTLPVSDTNNYGVQFVDVPVTISSATAGAIKIKDIDIKYDLTADIGMNPYTSGLPGSLNRRIPSDPCTGDVHIPVNISSYTAGTVTLKGLSVRYEQPNYDPTIGGIPNAALDEDTSVDHILDLSQYASDALDTPTDMSYMIQKNTGSKYVDVSVVDDHYLRVDPTKSADWNGETRVQVSVTDTGGKYAFSNYFNITVTPVNDEPTVGSEIPGVIMDEGTSFEALSLPTDVATSTYFEDIDSDTLSYWVEVDPDGIYDSEALTASIVENGDNDLVVLKASGDWNTADGTPVPVRVYCDDDDEKGTDGTFQDFEVQVYPVNDEPVWGTIPDLTILEDSGESDWVDLSTHITDVDNQIGDIKFKVVGQDPSSKYIQIALDGSDVTVKPVHNFFGDVEVTFQADDGDNKTTTKGYITVTGVNDLPTVKITSHSEGTIISEPTTLMGEADDPEDLQSVEIRIDSGSWIPLTSTFYWTYDLVPDELGNGPHAISVRAYDGEVYSSVAMINITVQVEAGTGGNHRPVVTILSPAKAEDVTFSGSEYTIRGRVSDSDGDRISWVRVKVGDSDWTAADGTTTWEYVLDTTGMENAPLTLQVKASDGTDESLPVVIQGSVSNQDGDHDGLPDGWEVDNFGDTTSNAGGDDPDADGYSNEDELLAGTDPMNAEEHPDNTVVTPKVSFLERYGIYMAIGVLALIVLIVLVVAALITLKPKKGEDDDDDDIPVLEAEPEAIPEAIDEPAGTPAQYAATPVGTGSAYSQPAYQQPQVGAGGAYQQPAQSVYPQAGGAYQQTAQTAYQQPQVGAGGAYQQLPPVQTAYPQAAQPAQSAYPQTAQPAQSAYPQAAQPAQSAYPQVAQPAQSAYPQTGSTYQQQ